MEIEEIDDGVEVKGLDMNLKNTFECGQCFRWNEQDNGSFIGVARGKVLEVIKDDDGIEFKNTTLGEFNEIWYNYFDIERDYDSIYTELRSDAVLKEALKYGSGIRILRQDPWECLVSFIISANNRIPQIKKVIENISRIYGRSIEYNGCTYYSFPTPDVLASLKEEELRETKCGFRAKYIIDAAKKVCDGFELDSLYKLDIDRARKELKGFNGIGDKVADCILLFAYGKTVAFPVDVWVKKVLIELYDYREKNISKIREFAADRFGQYAGFAQQYLFYYMRDVRG